MSRTGRHRLAGTIPGIDDYNGTDCDARIADSHEDAAAIRCHALGRRRLARRHSLTADLDGW